MFHVYLHVPFCRRRCTYCDFAIAVRRVVPSQVFVQSVCTELDIRGARESWTLHDVETLYLGGGTPSLLDSQDLSRLVDAIPRSPSAEVTIEANPDDVTRDAAAAWRAAGANRVSLGAQSFDDNVLRWMHRMHDGAGIGRAFDALRAAGFENISLDLIFGLPPALDHHMEDDLARAIALGPEHLSVYGLSVEPRTPLSRQIARGAVSPGEEGAYAHEFLLAHETLAAAGYAHYEVSSYAASPGRRSRHNGAYWTGAPYLGLGPSAHGFDGTRRRWNTRDWAAYRQRIEGGQDPLDGHETLDPDQRALERLYLGLRVQDGVAESDLPGDPAGRLRAAEQRGLLERRAGRLSATPQGWLVLDSLVTGLTTWAEGG